MAERKMNYQQRQGLTYVNVVPDFLKGLVKEDTRKRGYEPGSEEIEEKRRQLQFDPNQEDGDDEKPLIVSLKEGDLTEEEVSRLKEKGAKVIDEPKKQKLSKEKPKKNQESKNQNQNENESSEQPKHVFKKPEKNEESTTKKKKSSAKQVKNSKLLTFTEEDE